MKKFLILFLTFILFFSLPFSVFAAEPEDGGDENELEWEDLALDLSVLLGYVCEDLGDTVPVIGSLGEVLHNFAYDINSERVAELDAFFADGSITEYYYHQEMLSILVDSGYLDVSGGSVGVPEEFCAAVLDYIETSDLLDYKVVYTVSCYDVSASNWTDLIGWEVMKNAVTPKLDGNSDNQSFLNPDVPEDSQVYAVGRDTSGKIVYLSNVSGLAMVCQNSSQFQNIIDCNFDGKGSSCDFGNVFFLRY